MIGLNHPLNFDVSNCRKRLFILIGLTFLIIAPLALSQEDSDASSTSKVSEEVLPIEELLSTDSLPDLTPEMITAILISNAPMKPEWIKQINKLADKVNEATNAKVKKYTDRFLTVPIPYSSQKATGQVTLEPLKYATISFIDATGRPFDVTTVKPSNDQFEILGDDDIDPSNKPSRNHFIIRAISDYAEANLLVYLKDYEPLTNPIPGIYIAAQEFPKELMF